MRGHKREIDKSIRDLERENLKIVTQEKQRMTALKAAVKKNLLEESKFMIKDIVACRAHQIKFAKTKSQLHSLSLKLTTMTATQQMMTALNKVTKAISSINTKMTVSDMQKIMMQFERETGKLEMKEEMMDEVTNQDQDSEVQESTLTAQIYDEVGLNLDGKIKPSQSTLLVGDHELDRDRIGERLRDLKK